MMAFAITGTVFGVTSTILHFTPWPHGNNSGPQSNLIMPQTIAKIPFTAEELTKETMPIKIPIKDNIWPEYIHLKGEPYDRYYPIRFNSTPNKSTDFVFASFTDSKKQSHIISFSK